MVIQYLGAVVISVIGVLMCKKLVVLGIECRSMVQGVLLATAGILFGIMTGCCVVHLIGT